MEDSEFDKYRNKVSGYEVPEGYFESKRKSLRQIAEEVPKQKSKVIRLPFGWIASGVAAALLIGLFIWGPDTSAPTSVDFDFEQEELADYVYENYNYELNEQLLLLELSEEDLLFNDSTGISDDYLEILIDENFDQTLNYEYL